MREKYQEIALLLISVAVVGICSRDILSCEAPTALWNRVGATDSNVTAMVHPTPVEIQRVKRQQLIASSPGAIYITKLPFSSGEGGGAALEFHCTQGCSPRRGRFQWWWK